MPQKLAMLLRTLLGLLTGAGLLATGLSACMERPVIPGESTRGRTSAAAFPLGEFATADILLVVDDSPSMADKQRLLADMFAAVFNDNPTSEDSDGSFMGTSRFPTDTHIGVITTSLAIPGSPCSEGKGHLVPTPEGSPFLVLEDWSFPPYDTEKPALFEEWFTGVGQTGCGYEAPLEAAYRFLVDPTPKRRTTGSADASTDTELLQQRDAFLRPDSFVLIVMLSDEDDCSLSDSPAGLSMANPDGMAPASAACASNPDGICCRSCDSVESDPPAGCTSLEVDPSCASSRLPRLEDQPNVRCYNPRERFGIDGRFPTSRYIEGFSSATLSHGGKPVENPLFAGHRPLNSVRLLGIVGVPWQFVASEDTTSAPNALRVLGPDELISQDRWSLLLGADAEEPDPHLIESREPRPRLSSSSSPHAADPIHGHEYDNPSKDDLQYSCTFPLTQPRDCSTETQSCDCALVRNDAGDLMPSSPNRPLCQEATGSYGQTQYWGKAYPPPRLLEVLRATRGVVGSVCPKVVDPLESSSSAYGYTAAFRALMDGVSGAFGLSCLDRDLPIEEGRVVGCKVVEMVAAHEGCNALGRTMAPDAYADRLRALMRPGEDANFSFCELLPVQGDSDDPSSPAYSCLHDVEVSDEAYGYCFIDPKNGLGATALVERCPSDAQRRVRLVPFGVGRSGPLKESPLRLVCL